MPADGTQILKRYERLKEAASAHFRLCEDMAPYVSPSRVGMLSKRTPGQSQVRQVTDSTTMMAAELMAQFVAGYVINPGQQWGTMRMQNPALRGSDEINEWLEDCRDRMLAQFDASMFYAEGVETLVDWGGFGTGFLLCEELPQAINRTQQGFRGFLFQAKKTGRFVICDGPDGLVDTVYDAMELTAGVMEARWGKAAMPENVKKALTEGDKDKAFTVVHAIYPRPLAEQRYAAGAFKMPYASCWVEKESKHLVSESGYPSFPGGVPRYSRTPGEVFGRGRGHLAFPDTWTLNTAKRMGLEDWAFKIRPPVLHSHDSVIGTLRLTPAGPTSINTHGKSISDSIMPFQTGSHPEVSQIKEEELRKSIRQIFFVDQILMLMEVNKSEMTAFEFAKKMELLFKIMGPVYGRTEHEFLRRIWDISFDTMLAAGAFAPPPEAIYETDGNIGVVFQNPIARAQRSGDVEAITQAVADLTPLGQVYPQVWDKFDPDKTASHIFAVRGVPAIVTRNEDEIASLRDERLKQQETEQALAEAGQIAESAGKAAPMLQVLQGGARPR